MDVDEEIDKTKHKICIMINSNGEVKEVEMAMGEIEIVNKDIKEDEDEPMEVGTENDNMEKATKGGGRRQEKVRKREEKQRE